MSESYGIPITSGKMLSKGEHGVVLSFNMEHLYLSKLLRAQLFSSDHKPLTGITLPTFRLTDIYEYPLSSSSPNFAFVQHARSAIIFIKYPDFEFSRNTRVVLWFARNSIPVNNTTDYVDVPTEYMPYAEAILKKLILERMGKEIPKELEDTIKEWADKIKRGGSSQNFYLEDTFNLSQDEIDKLGKDSIEDKVPQVNNKDSNNLKRFNHGELKKRIKVLLKQDNCKKNETVSSTKIAKWVRDITNEGYFTSESIIRAKLSNMGYTSEKTESP